MSSAHSKTYRIDFNYLELKEKEPVADGDFDERDIDKEVLVQTKSNCLICAYVKHYSSFIHVFLKTAQIFWFRKDLLYHQINK